MNDDVAPPGSRAVTVMVALLKYGITSEPTAVTVGAKSAISGVPKKLANRDAEAIAVLPLKFAGATNRSLDVPDVELNDTPGGIVELTPEFRM